MDAFLKLWFPFVLLFGIVRLPGTLVLWSNASLVYGGGDRHSLLQNLHALQASDSGLLSNIALLVGGILTIFAQAGMFRAAFVAMAGPGEGLLESLRLGAVRFWPLFGTGLLFALGVVAGLILLVVPGFILLAMWFVATPACIVEKLGPIDSLRRSAELTKGHRLKILGLIALALLVYLTVYMVVLAIVSVAVPGMSVLVIMDYVFQVLSTAGSIALIVAIYHDLRAMDERATTPRADAIV